MKKIAFTLCSNNYLAQAITLKNSFLELHNDYEFYIGLVDKKSKEIDYSDLNIVEVESLKIDTFNNMVKKYNIVELNTSVKPFYFQHFFKNNLIEVVKYIDPDIMFFDTLSKLDNEIHFENKMNFWVTPHITSPIPFDEFHPHQENKYLNFGIFNFGFLSLKKSDDVLAFLKWWSERLKTLCIINVSKGFFVDQLWGNFIPIFFRDTCHISLHLGLNMAHWNIHERKVTKDENNKFQINSEFELVFYHFSNYNPHDTHEKLNVRTKFNLSLNDRPDLRPLFSTYKEKLLKNDYDLISKFKPYYLKESNQEEGKGSFYLKKYLFNIFKAILNRK